MRALLRTTIAILAVTALAAAAQGDSPMRWQPNLETAQRLAAQTNRLVLIHFWAPWCRPCMQLEQQVFSKPETGAALEANFVMVKLNADDAPGTARMYGVSSLPTDVITTPSGQLVSQVQSPPTATQYVQQMNQAAAGHRSLAQKPNSPGVQRVEPQGAPVTPPPTTGALYDPYSTPNPAGPTGAQPGAATEVAAAPVAPATAAPPVAPPMDAALPNAPAPTADRYAEFYPPAQSPAAPGAADSQVMPAQAYGSVGPAAAQAPLVDPYATPADASAAATPAPSADPYAAPAANPYATPAAPATNPYAAAPNPYASNPYASAPPAAQAPVNPYAAAAAAGAGTATAPNPNLPQLPPGCPAVALDGNCPVTLLERRRWAQGHPSFGAVHRGRTYLFLGPQERDKFLTDPDRYSPVLSGLDPVLAAEGQSVHGKREFGVFGADGKVYLFANEASRAKFEESEMSYASRATQMMQQQPGLPQQPAAYQAMRP